MVEYVGADLEIFSRFSMEHSVFFHTIFDGEDMTPLKQPPNAAGNADQGDLRFRGDFGDSIDQDRQRFQEDIQGIIADIF